MINKIKTTINNKSKKRIRQDKFAPADSIAEKNLNSSLPGRCKKNSGYYKALL